MYEEWLKIGVELKSAREGKGVSVEEVAERLKIRRCYIDAIEEGAFGEIPGKVTYVSAFLRSYAQFLGKNPEVYITRYKDSYNADEDEEVFVIPDRSDFYSRPSVLVFTSIVLLAVLVYGVWYGSQHYGVGMREDAKTDALLSHLDSQKKERLVHDAQQDVGVVPNRDVTADPKVLSRLVLLVKENTWIRVVGQQDALLLEKDMMAGDTYFLPEQEDLIITAGNPEVVEVFVDGEQHSFLGTLHDISQGRQ